MTLVIKLGLDIIQIHPCDKLNFGVFTSIGSVVKVAEQQTLTDIQTLTQTEPILYPGPLTREGMRTPVLTHPPLL